MTIETAKQMNRRIRVTNRKLRRRAWFVRNKDNLLGAGLCAAVLVVHLGENSIWYDRWQVEHDAKAAAQAKYRELATWTQPNLVQFTIKGQRATVANIAQQFATTAVTQ